VSENNCDIDNLLKLSIHKQKLSAILRIEPNQSGIAITADALCAFLEGSEIHSKCILAPEIEQIIEMATANPHLAHEMIVAKGTDPIDGQNAAFEFCDDVQIKLDKIEKRQEAYLKAENENTLTPNDSEEENTGSSATDFYNDSPFLIVAKNDLIGKIVAAIDGEDGVNVLGQAIPTKPGKDLSDIIDASFKMDEQGNVYATVDGHLTYTAGKLRINPILEIASYVDFSTGNIEFPREVIVKEGVRSRFSVKAGENLEIRKLVEASVLESMQDVILHNGMAGKDTGTIHAGRDLKAGYLDGVHACVLGDCQINKEITNCYITISGMIQSPTAALRGGEISTSKGGIIGSIGSIQGVKTEVIIGSLPEIESKIRLAQKLRPRVEESINKQQRELETLVKSLGKPNREQATEIEFMKFETSILEEKLVDLDNAIDRLAQIVREHAAYKLDVKSMIFAKTVVWLPGFKLTFDNDVKGEFSLNLNKSRKPVIIRNGKTEPANTVARVIADDRVLPAGPVIDDGSLSDDSDESLDQAA
jgi:uncharacterized protein